jgi:di/tricarboxylate transporter
MASSPRKAQPLPQDTLTLLRSGGIIFGAGVIAALLTATVLGGIGRQGPHTNLGWLSLMIALGCLPFGTLLLALGFAKWIGHHR